MGPFGVTEMGDRSTETWEEHRVSMKLINTMAHDGVDVWKEHISLQVISLFNIFLGGKS